MVAGRGKACGLRDSAELSTDPLPYASTLRRFERGGGADIAADLFTEKLGEACPDACGTARIAAHSRDVLRYQKPLLSLLMGGL